MKKLLTRHEATYIRKNMAGPKKLESTTTFYTSLVAKRTWNNKSKQDFVVGYDAKKEGTNRFDQYIEWTYEE